MEKVLSFIGKETGGTCYKSFKYCYEGIEIPKIIYDDKQHIIFSKDKNGETDKSLKQSKSLAQKTKELNKFSAPLFKYFLDGSRRTYKIDDIAYANRIYPIIGGQIGVGCCQRTQASTFKPAKLFMQCVLSLPDCADADGQKDLFFNNLSSKLNNLPSLQKRNIGFSKKSL